MGSTDKSVQDLSHLKYNFDNWGFSLLCKRCGVSRWFMGRGPYHDYAAFWDAHCHWASGTETPDPEKKDDSDG